MFGLARNSILAINRTFYTFPAATGGFFTEPTSLALSPRAAAEDIVMNVPRPRFDLILIATSLLPAPLAAQVLRPDVPASAETGKQRLTEPQLAVGVSPDGKR